MMVTGASFEPSAMSPSSPAWAISAAVWALAWLTSCQGETPSAAAKAVMDRAAVKVRRVMFNGLLRKIVQSALSRLMGNVSLA